MRDAFRQAFARLLPARPITVPLVVGPLAGLRLRADFSLRPQYFIGRYEPRVAAVISRQVAVGATAWDVGANIGYFSLMMRRQVGSAGQVLAFEPSPHAAQSLEINARLNPGNSFTVYRIALADRDGREAFSDFDFDVVAHLGDDSARHPDAHVSEVRLATVDRLLEEGLPPPDFVKIDVEGAEVRVLEGMRETLRQRRPRLLIEVHSDELESQVRHHLPDHSIEVLGSEVPRHLICT